MIVRMWQARATAQNAPKYRDHLVQSVFPQLCALDGFQGGELLMTPAEPVEIVVQTRWRDMDAVRAFAGDAPAQAVVEPAAEAVLASFDRTVRHFEVASELRP